jgi:HEAT repeats
METRHHLAMKLADASKVLGTPLHNRLMIGAGTLAFVLVSSSCSQSLDALDAADADALVLELHGLPTEIYVGPSSFICAVGPSPCLPPPVPPTEVKRQRVYRELYELGDVGVEALTRGLIHGDRSIRSNSVLALSVLSGRWYDSGSLLWKVDIRAALPALIGALHDRDSRTRGLAAQAIGGLGPAGAEAVPELIKMATSSDEGVRNSACIGLERIGPSGNSGDRGADAGWYRAVRSCRF